MRIQTRLSCFLILALFFPVFSPPVTAQEGAWKLYSSPSPRTDVALAPMDDRGAILMFGGVDPERFHGDTWKFYAGSWSRIVGAGPSPRSRAAMAWDPQRKVVVLFGGLYRTTVCGDTWEWDGRRWRQKAANQKNIPLPREGASMAYDAGRGTIILFGGKNDSTCYSDTWEWNGRSWRFITIAQPPLPRTKAAMAWCQIAGGIIMFGGLNVYEDVADTWLWRDGSWKQLAVSGPSAREAAAMAPHPDGGVLLVGGARGDRTFRDRWIFDGAAWARLKGRGPGKRAGAGLAIIGATDQMLLFGGWKAGVVNDETWTLSNTLWNRLKPFAPSPRAGAAAAWDPVRQRLVLFGGMDAKGSILADTWEWNRFTGWHKPLATGPGARSGAAMIWDPDRQAVVMQGGRRPYAPNDPFTWTDTWSYDGQSWTKLAESGPESSGALARSAAYAADVMLEGGEFPDPALTYRLTDQGWQALALEIVPELRTRARMASGDDGVYLFGGFGYEWSHMWPVLHRDLWLLDGEGWQRVENEKPDARQDHLLACPANQPGVILHGGSDTGRDPNSWSEYYSFLWKTLPDTWRWDGLAWRMVSALGPAREGHAVARLDPLHTLLFFGGMERIDADTKRYYNDLWVYDENYGAVGDFDIGLSSLSASSDEWHSGDQVTMTARYSLQGSAAAPAMPLHLYLSLDERLDARDLLVASRTIDAVSPATTESTAKMTFGVKQVIERMPAWMRTAAQRNRFYLIAVIDQDESTKDRDRGNNTCSTEWYVTISF
jgi:hypothetical protein